MFLVAIVSTVVVTVTQHVLLDTLVVGTLELVVKTRSCKRQIIAIKLHLDEFTAGQYLQDKFKYEDLTIPHLFRCLLLPGHVFQTKQKLNISPK